MNSSGSFPCDQCGLCCQHVSLSDETAWLDRGDGVCRHYDEKTKLCEIYETRPLICRVREQYDLRFKSLFSWQDFVELNLEACRQLKAGELTSTGKSHDGF